MDVPDLVVVLLRSGSDLGSSDKDVSKCSRFPVSLDSMDKIREVLVSLHVESGVPLSVFDGVGNIS